MTFVLGKRLLGNAVNEVLWHLLIMNQIRRVLVDYHRLAGAGSVLIGRAALEVLELMAAYRGASVMGGYKLTYTVDKDLANIWFTLRDAEDGRDALWTHKIQAVKPEAVHRILAQAPLRPAAAAA